MLGTLALGTTAVVAKATPTENFSFGMPILARQTPNYPTSYGEEFRSTSDNSDPFRVSIVDSGEGYGSYYNWYLANTSFQDLSPGFVTSYTGEGSFYGPGGGSYQDVFIMGVNPSWVDSGTIWVDGNWTSNVY